MDDSDKPSAKADKRARKLKAILEISTIINSSRDLNHILISTCKSAVDLLEVSHSGIVLFDQHLDSGEVYAEYPDLEPKGARIQLRGVSAEEKLIASKKPLPISDVASEQSLGPVRDLLLKHDIRSTVFVPIMVKERMLGSFSLDSIGHAREFTDEDIEFCKIFATQVATAIANAQRATALEEFHKISLDITQHRNIPELAQSILDRAVSLLGAKGGGLYLLYESGKRFRLTAVSNLPKHVIGKDWAVGEGVIGEVIRTKAPFTVSDYQKWPKRLRDYDEYGFTTVAGAPIVWQEQIWGVIGLHDVRAGRSFDQEDLDLLSHLGNLAAAAFENSRRMDERDRLIASAFDAIIAVNEAGEVVEFNKRAEEILGYKANEVLGRPVSFLYYPPAESHKIQQQLLRDLEGGRSGLSDLRGRLTDYSSSVKSKDGERIPIRLSATLLFDHEGTRTGSVGFFRDLRKIESAERQIQTLSGLLAASKAINSNVDLSGVLKTVVELGRDLVGADYGALAVPDLTGKIETFITSPQLDFLTGLPTGEGLLGLLLREQKPIRIKDLRAHSSFKGYPLHHPQMTSFLGVPIVSRNRIIGSLYMADKSIADEFSEEDQQILERLADQAAIAIVNARLYEETKQRLNESRALQRVCVSLTETLHLDAVLNEVVQATISLTSADEGSILLYETRQDKFVRALTSSGINQPLRSYQSHVLTGERKGIAYAIIKDNKPIFISDTHLEDGINPVVIEKGRKAVAGLPLPGRQGPIGVLYANWKEPRQFTEQEKSLLTAFAAQASVAIQNAQDHEQISKAKDAADRVSNLMVLGDIGKTKDSIPDEVRIAVGCDVVVLYEYDQIAGVLDYPPNFAGLPYPKGEWPYLRLPPHSVAYSMLRQDRLYIAKDVTTDPLFSSSPFAKKEGIKSSVAIPLRAGDDTVGVMFANYYSLHRFSDDEIVNIRLIANQAAVAISNAQRYESIKRSERYLMALHGAAKAMTASFGLGHRRVLDHIVEQAVNCLQSGEGPKAHLGTIELYDEAANELSFESIYPIEKYPKLVERIGQCRTLATTSIMEGVGISGRAVLTGKPQLVLSARKDAAYIEYDANTQSELAVPLLDGTQVLGVLNVESAQLDAFDTYDQETLQALAELAVIAIKNSRQYEELRKTKGLIGSRSALAWMGMMSTLWRHSIEGYALAIRDTVPLLRAELERTGTIEEKLNRIENSASKILERPIISPLSSEVGVTSVFVNRLIQDRIRELEKSEPFNKVSFHLEAGLTSNQSVRASLEWLRRVIDLLVDNAAKAMAASRSKIITFVTRCANGGVEIAIRDTGAGVPEELRPKILQVPVRKPQGSKGMGIGLLIAQAIVEAFGGQLHLESTGPQGTTFTIWLPLERPEND